MRVSFLIAGVSVAIGLILLVNYWGEFAEFAGFADTADEIAAVPEAASQDPSPAQPPPALPSPEPAEVLPAQPAPAPVEPLPQLAASDEYVRQLIGELTGASAGQQGDTDSSPTTSLAEVWLQRQDLVARASSVLANAASGRIPFRQLTYLVPTSAFPVTQIGEQYFLDRSGEQRYDSYIDVMTALSAERAVQAFDTLSPLFDEALGQLGERRSARQLLIRAIETVQIRARQLPTLPPEVELLRPNLMYAYADPDLEALPDMDKLLLRMGPDNVQRLSEYLSEIKGFL